MTDDQFLIYAGVAVVVWTLIGLGIGAARGRAAFGLLLGFLLGPIGWLIVLILPKEGPRCPECMEVVNAGARRCHHCYSEIVTSDNPFPRLSRRVI